MLRRIARFRRVISTVVILVVTAAAMSMGNAWAHGNRDIREKTALSSATGVPPCHEAKAITLHKGDANALCLALCEAASPDHFHMDAAFSPPQPVKAKAIFSDVTFTRLSGMFPAPTREAVPPIKSARFRPLYLQTQRLLI